MSLLWLAPLRLAGALLAGAQEIDAAPHGIAEVAWSGCAAERRGPWCVTARGDALVLWTRLRDPTRDSVAMRCGADSSLTVGGRGHTVIATGPDAGGCWTRLTVDDPSGVLELRDPDGRLLWSLPFAGAPTEDPAVTEARARFRAGDDIGARRRLRGALESTATAPLDRARALDLDWRIALASDDLTRDDLTRGLESARAARELYRSLGWTSSACDITYALIHHHWVTEGDATAARVAMRDGVRCVAELPRYALHQRHAHAMLVEGLGDPLDTSLAYRNVDVLARRLRDFDFEAAILSAQHVVADQVHDRKDARRIELRMDALEALLAGAPSCGRINALSNLSWSVLMRRERGEPAPDPWPVITAVREQYAVGPCRSAEDLRNATINLALAELQRADPARAIALLHGDEPGPHDPEGELWWHLVLARAGLAQGNFKLAGVHVLELDDLARRHADPYFGWHAAFARGELLAAEDRPEQAIAALQEAEALRDEMALPLALGAGRERAGARWDDSAGRLITLQIAQGRPDAALRTARLSRRRALAAVAALAALPDPKRGVLAREVRRRREAIDDDARRDVRRSGVELERIYSERRQQRLELRRLFDAPELGHFSPSPALREPAANEVLLVYHPLREGWIGFAADGEQVFTAAIHGTAEISDEALGQALYEPFAAAISRAHQVRIIAAGALLARDLHGLPLRGKPLLAHAAVAYALDLDMPSSASRPLARGLIVAANPGGEIPRLRFVEREAVDVAVQWGQLELVTTRLGAGTATRQAVLRALPSVDLLHFIGHHIPGPEVDQYHDAWNYGLPLDQGTSLAVEEILSVVAVSMPRVVFLSACQTGMVDPKAASGGVAIAHSFLLRGAELVIATARLVDDREAARVADAFYSAAPDAASLADPVTLAEAQRELLGDAFCCDDPDVCGRRAHVCAYRAWVP